MWLKRILRILTGNVTHVNSCGAIDYHQLNRQNLCTLSYRTFFRSRPRHDDWCEIKKKSRGCEKRKLTVSSLGFHNDVALYYKVLQAWPLRCIQLGQSQVAYSHRPEALEHFSIFAPRLDDNIQCGASFNSSLLEKREDSIELSVNQESERNDKTLIEKNDINGGNRNSYGTLTCINVAVLALVIRPTMACSSSGRTGRIASPDFRNKWMIRSPIASPPDSS
jgi:hypothetical protein